MLKVAGSNPVARSISFFRTFFAALALSAALHGVAGADASTWQLRAGSIPSTTSAALSPRVALVLLDLGGFEMVASIRSQYATPSPAEIAASMGPDAEERLRDRLRSGDRTALMPLVLLLTAMGDGGRAEVYFEGRGTAIPANRRDLALAAAWYGRYTLNQHLADLPPIPPDLGGDDASGTIAAVLDAGWMILPPDGLFHPLEFVTNSDIATISAAFSIDAGAISGTIFIDELDPLFRSQGATASP